MFSIIETVIIKISAEERCVYVGQREMAVGSVDDNIAILGSEDATTCHVVILRDVTTDTDTPVTGIEDDSDDDHVDIVIGLAHIDSDEPGQFLALERAVRDRKG